MRPRQSLIDIFSTFVQFDADRFHAWATDSQLRRSIQNCLGEQSASRHAQGFWILYWHQQWQKHPEGLARAHLSAYLQESCYWVAYKTSTRFGSSQYRMSDCFQISIAAIDRILKGFNRNQGSKLKDYASIVFKSVLKDTLRQRHETDLCTDWALLRKLSKKRLVESLRNTGFSPDTIAQYQLAWTCFKALYVPTQATGTRQLTKPDPQTWEAISKRYNDDRDSQLPSPGDSCSPQTLEAWLVECAKWARFYLYPPIDPINPIKPENGSDESLENLPGSDNSLLAQAIAQEEAENRQAQMAEIEAVLVAAIEQLSPQIQELLKLYYSQGLTQQQIAQETNIKQYTVSRWLNKARSSLLEALARWGQQKQQLSLSSQTLKQMSGVLEEWLQGYL